MKKGLFLSMLAVALWASAADPDGPGPLLPGLFLTQLADLF